MLTQLFFPRSRQEVSFKLGPVSLCQLQFISSFSDSTRKCLPCFSYCSSKGYVFHLKVESLYLRRFRAKREGFLWKILNWSLPYDYSQIFVTELVVTKKCDPFGHGDCLCKCTIHTGGHIYVTILLMKSPFPEEFRYFSILFCSPR